MRHHLNTGNATLSGDTTERLFAARQTALARHAALGAELATVSAGRHVLVWCADQARPVLFALGLVAALAVSNLWLAPQQPASDLEAIDTALLTDELPLDAYLDSGFRAWLAESSQY
ncbi:MAG: hypothetical protein BSR46_00380 [Candidatus Dactylopiibacterium carminicum]|nr:MAG: hypothetical protein BSR46_00380 [Candidatus Dactylopiibacterium carminicum]